MEPRRWDVHDQAGEQLVGVEEFAASMRGRLVPIEGTPGLEPQALEALRVLGPDGVE